MKSRLRLAQDRHHKTKWYLEYHWLADTGSDRYTPNCSADKNVHAWWKQTSEEMGVYFDQGAYPGCTFAAVRSYLDKASENVDPGVVGTVCDIVKQIRIRAFLRYCATAELLP